MIKIHNKVDCCGCNACGDACAHGAITFKTDIEGFWYPEVDMQKCTDCHLCESVCPILNIQNLKKNEFEEPKCFGAVHKNLEVRFKSTSGGMFTAFAEYILKSGGVVGGSTYTNEWGAEHILIANKSELDKIRGSKYMQSSMEGFFHEIKRALVEGKNVLVCGSPCQMAAVRSYFKKGYDNLYIVDWICFGIPSTKFFQKYIEYWEKKAGSRLSYFQFKIKDLGWRKRCMKLGFVNGKHYYEDGEESLFDFGYHRAHVICRPSCYNCVFKNKPYISDITLGDLWGIEKLSKNIEIDGDMGTSVVMCHNSKGLSLFSAVKQKIISVDVGFEDVVRGNTALVQSHHAPLVDRDKFYERLENDDFEKLMTDVYSETAPSMSFKHKIKIKLKECYHKLKYLREIFHNGPRSIFLYFKYNSLKDIFFGTGGVILPLSHCVLDIHKTARIIVKEGAFRIGYKKVKGSKLETRLYMEENSKIVVNGDYTIFYGGDIEIFKNAVLKVGNQSGLNIGCNIVCQNSITIGDTVAVGRNVTIRDNNGGHYIGLPGYKNCHPVVIEDHAWLCESCTIMPGSYIGTGAIIGARTIVSGKIQPFTMVSGNPAKVVESNVYWKS